MEVRVWVCGLSPPGVVQPVSMQTHPRYNPQIPVEFQGGGGVDTQARHPFRAFPVTKRYSCHETHTGDHLLHSACSVNKAPHLHLERVKREGARPGAGAEAPAYGDGTPQG